LGSSPGHMFYSTRNWGFHGLLRAFSASSDDERQRTQQVAFALWGAGGYGLPLGGGGQWVFVANVPSPPPPPPWLTTIPDLISC
jgi:hypothetical protein